MQKNDNLSLFLERTIKLVGEERFPEVKEALSTKRNLSIRVNTLAASLKEVEIELRKLNVHFRNVIWNSHALVLEGISTKQLTETELYTKGKIYIQNLSSMIPPLILQPQPGERILDIAAAPGSKTTQMAALMNNEGEIIANDISRTRLFKLEANLRRNHIKNVKISQCVGQKIWEKYPGYFDKVLVDAPCSLEGMINLNEPETYCEWSQKKVKNLAKQQQWLLRSAISAVKPGGIVVYSTCTMAPEENEGVIDWILRREKGKIVLEDIFLPGYNFENVLLSWNDKKYNNEIIKAKRILPTREMEAFFVARIRTI